MFLQDENTRIMIRFYKEMFHLKKCSTQLYRYLKLNILSESDNLVPNINVIKKKNFFKKTKYWTIINEFKNNTIISGSLSLKAFGFLEREVSDVDLIIKSENLPSIINSLSSSRIDKRYPEDCVEYMIGSFLQNKVIVDIYASKNEDIIEFEGFKFHNPYEIMKNKLDLFMNDANTKHFQDIKYYLSKINKTSICLDR